MKQLSATGYTKEYYDQHREAGLDYLGFGTWHTDYGEWFVESLELKGKSLLDVGCACGAILRGLGGAGAIVQGVDASEAMIRLGRENWPDMSPLLHVGDAVNLHIFPDAAFDALHSNNVAEHWHPELVPFILRELRRITKPGGILWIAFDSVESTFGRDISKEDPTHICIRPMEWWSQQLINAGWSLEPALLIKMKSHPKDYSERYGWGIFAASNPSITTWREQCEMVIRGGSVAVVTMFDKSMSDIGELTIDNKRRYAERHGYDFICHREPLTTNRAVVWSKDVAVLRALPYYKAVFWTDADSVILDLEKPLSDFLEIGIDFVYGSDHFNNGNFIIRNTPDAFNFLENVWVRPMQDAALSTYEHPLAKKWSQVSMATIRRERPHGLRMAHAGSYFGGPYYQSGRMFALHCYGSNNVAKWYYLDEALHPARTFNDGSDVDALSMFQFKGRLLEFCGPENFNRSTVAMKFARAGWQCDIVALDIDPLRKAFAWFNSVGLHFAGPPGITYDIVSIQEVADGWQMENAMAGATYVICRTELSTFAEKAGFTQIIKTFSLNEIRSRSCT